jgi:transcriptional regulator with XRE-family HTH domain
VIVKLKRIEKKKFAELLIKAEAQKFPNQNHASVARAIGITAQRLNSWRMGKVLPAAELLPAVLAAFDIPVKDFMSLHCPSPELE